MNTARVALRSIPRRRLELIFGYDPTLHPTLKSRLGARWDPEAKTWWIAEPATRRSAEKVLKTLTELGFRRGERALEEWLAQEPPPSLQVRLDVLSDRLLRPYQAVGAEFLISNRRSILADVPGLGKTTQALAAVETADAWPMVVVCPAAVRSNWTREIAACLPHRTVESVAAHHETHGLAVADALVVSYDGLGMHRSRLPTNIRSIVLDECHYVRSSDTRRLAVTREVVAALPADGVLIGLSGTPFVNRNADLLPMLQMIDRISDFDSVPAFLERYCDPNPVWRKDGRCVTTHQGSTRTRELNTKLFESGIMLRRRKHEVLADLPPKQVAVRLVDLPDEWQVTTGHAAIAAHKTNSDRRVHGPITLHGRGPTMPRASEALNNDIKEMPTHGRAITALRQITAAAKIDIAVEWIGQWLLGHDSAKLIVFAWHREINEAIAEKFGVRPLYGAVHADARQSIIDNFQADPDSRLLVASYEAVGVGVNLTSASDILFVEQPWTPAACQQAEDRCHRIGQQQPVSVTYLVARNTIDEAIWECLERKQAVGNAVIDGPKSNSAQETLDAISVWLERSALETMELTNPR